MTWTSADYRSYPARCLQFHLLAAASPEPILVGAWLTNLEARSEATLFRQYRFLVRANPGVDFAIDKLFSDYSFRTRIVTNEAYDSLLYLTAKPELSNLIPLNPHLADILMA